MAVATDLKLRVNRALPRPLKLRLRRMRSRLSRRADIERYLASTSTRKLHLGCGPYPIDGWLNTDLQPVKRDVVFVDASRPLPFGDRAFDYVFSEHLIEHLEYLDGIRLLGECYRVLKPGGRLRISTPDLRFLLDLYATPRTEFQQRYLEWATTTFGLPCAPRPEIFVINNFFHAWGHRFIFDRDVLMSALTLAGFTNLTSYKPGHSNDPELMNLEQHGKSIPSEFNELESMIIECERLAG